LAEELAARPCWGGVRDIVKGDVSAERTGAGAGREPNIRAISTAIRGAQPDLGSWVLFLLCIKKG